MGKKLDTELPFEQAFAQLEEIVQRLEAGDLTLQEALDVYEQGMTVARHCQTLLDEAELRVTELQEGVDDARGVPSDVEE